MPLPKAIVLPDIADPTYQIGYIFGGGFLFSIRSLNSLVLGLDQRSCAESYEVMSISMQCVRREIIFWSSQICVFVFLPFWLFGYIQEVDGTELRSERSINPEGNWRSLKGEEGWCDDEGSGRKSCCKRRLGLGDYRAFAPSWLILSEQVVNGPLFVL